MERAAPCKTGCLGSLSGRSDKGRGRANAAGSKPLTEGNRKPTGRVRPSGNRERRGEPLRSPGWETGQQEKKGLQDRAARRLVDGGGILLSPLEDRSGPSGAARAKPERRGPVRASYSGGFSEEKTGR